MLTAKRLREALQHCPDDMEVVTNTGEAIVHMGNTDTRYVLSTEKPLGYCNKCGSRAFPEHVVPDYVGYCPECDENLYEFEIDKDDDRDITLETE